MGCVVSGEQKTAVREFSASSSRSSSTSEIAPQTSERGERLGDDEFPMTEERRMISSSLGEADDWLSREREKLRRLQALPPIRSTNVPISPSV